MPAFTSVLRQAGICQKKIPEQAKSRWISLFGSVFFHIPFATRKKLLEIITTRKFPRGIFPAASTNKKRGSNKFSATGSESPTEAV